VGRRSYYMRAAMASAVYELGRSRWPQIRLGEAAFAARLGDAGDIDPERAGDLFLAFAIAERIPGAIEAFHAELDRDLGAIHARFANVGLALDELRQLLVTRICLGDDGRAPTIASYRGRGSLRSWLRVTAVRALTDTSRVERRTRAADSDVDELQALGSSPDIAYLQRRFGDAIKRVLQNALAELSSDERALLRQRYLHGLQVDEIARLRAIHRVTASRALARVHDRLLAHARRALEREVGADLDGVMVAVKSGLELSLSRVLAATAA
jgi:RNA polymerase sigma-70 factor, ECF subfamily